MKKRNILAVLPMRSGSTGIRHKNISDVNGLPLFTYAARTLTSLTSIKNFIVSTDSQRYAELALEAGLEVPFTRPPHLADNQTRLHYVLKHALNYFDEQGQHFDAVLSVQATAPLIRAATLEKMIAIFHDTDCEAIGTGSFISHGHPYLAKQLDPDSNIVQNFLALAPGQQRYPRQVRPELYYFNGAAFLRDRKLLDQIDDDTNCLGLDPRMLVIDEMEGLNIDSEFDLQMAEMFLKNQDVL